MRLRPAYLGWPLLAIIVLVVVVVAAAASLMASEQGSRWLVQRGIAVAGVPLEIEGIHGTLLRGIEAERLHYRTDTIDVRATGIILTPDWISSLADDRIVVRLLAVDELAVRRLGEPLEGEDPEPIEFTFPEFPILSLQVDEVRARHFRFEDLDEGWAARLRGSVFWSRNEFRLRDLLIEAPNLQVASPRLRLHLDGDQAMGGQLSWQLFDGNFAGNATLGGTLRTLQLDHQLASPIAVHTAGSVGLVGQREPTVDLAFEAPEIARQPLQAERVEASLRGTPRQYAGEVRGQLDVDQRASGAARVVFEGDLQGIVLRPLEFDSPAGELTAHGHLNWTPHLQISLEVQGTRIDPAQLGAPASGALALDGALHFEGQRLMLRIHEVSGQYAGTDFSASGDLELADGVWTGDGLELTSGDNRIVAAGRFGDAHIEADVELSLRQPGILLPGVEGDVRGEIRVSGPLDALAATVALSSDSIAWQDLELGAVQLDAERSGDGQHARAVLSAAYLDYVELELRDLSLSGSGDDSGGQLDLAWRFFDQPHSTVRADVARRDEGFAVALARGAELATPYGSWRLDSTANVDVDLQDDHLRVSAHCWVRAREAGRVCLERLARAGGETELAGLIDALPLQWVHVFAEGLPQFAGQLDADWQIRHDAVAGTLHGQLEWTTTGLGLTGFAVDADDQEAVIVLPELAGAVNFGGDQLDATLVAVLNGEQVLDVGVRVADLAAERRLDGRAALSITDVSFLATLFEELGSFEGVLSGEVAVSGNAEDPRVRGHLELSEGGMVWLNPYLELEQLRLRAEMEQPDRIRLSGSATNNRNGELNLDGTVEQPFSADRVASITMQGRELLVQIPDSQIWASPDLTFTWRAQQASVTGTMEVPRATLVAPELPEAAVGRSVDVMVVGREEEPDEPLRLAANVRVIIGDDVQLEGFGLVAGLAGDLRMRRTLDGAVSLDGRVDIREGQFSAYGQTLEIDTGNLTFAGPPDNPFVNARAVRRIERPGQDITVGILITGDLNNLESTLISDPPMSEGNALSYLMLGRPLRDSTPGEGDQLVGAAVALGLRQAAPLIEEVGRTLGLDEFGAVGDEGDDLTVIAGKQLTSRLFVRYTYHAFLGVSAMMLRYELTDRLSLETTASDTPGVDVMYRVTD
jgi:translocation and assembly module TamB